MNKTRVLIIYTGGTIGMMHEHRKKSLVPVDLRLLMKEIPELKAINCAIRYVSLSRPIDSSNVQPDFWIKLSVLIESNYSKYDGFVILHGTDTMAYTASALSFMLENLSKPVILTGSQLPLRAIRTDAKRNLITSVQLAAGRQVIPEVCIYFSNQLFRGNRAEKYTSSKFDAFESYNYPLLAEAGVHIRYNNDFILVKPNGKLKVHRKLDTNIALIKLYPGIHPAAMESVIRTKGLRAVIIETFGSGNAPTGDKFLDTLRDAVSRGISIFNVSQCSGGAVEQGKYETSIKLKEMGVVSGGDITTESAISKLMFLYGQGHSDKEVRKLFGKNLRGELTE